MRVLVQTAFGTSFELVVAPDDDVYLLKCKIRHKLGIPVAQQHLMYNLVELTNSEHLSNYAIKDGCVLKLLVSLKNGLISDCGRTISTLDHIQWTELKYFLENNRDEAMGWLHAGYKGLVMDDDDDDFFTHFLMDTPQTLFLPGIPLTEEDCVTKCKMIDVQSRMRELSLKRYEKNYQSPFEGSDGMSLFPKDDCPCGEGNHVESMLSGVRFSEPFKRYITRSPTRLLPSISRNTNISHSGSSKRRSDFHLGHNVDELMTFDRSDHQTQVRSCDMNSLTKMERVNNFSLGLNKDREYNQKNCFLPPIENKIKDKGKKHGKSERTRCFICKKRLSIATLHNCQCGGVFCAPHRYAEVHNCQYDYTKEWLTQLHKANPPAYSFPKLPKI